MVLGWCLGSVGRVGVLLVVLGSCWWCWDVVGGVGMLLVVLGCC